MADLSPCPFCGHGATIQFSFGAWSIACEYCGASKMTPCGFGPEYDSSRDAAIAGWNQRQPLPVSVR